MSILFVAALGVWLLAGGVAPAHADDRDHDRKCEKRIHRAEEKLRKEVDRHGEHSRQAERKRHELEEARRSCHEERREEHREH
jgi:hypothetical protein